MDFMTQNDMDVPLSTAVCTVHRQGYTFIPLTLLDIIERSMDAGMLAFATYGLCTLRLLHMRPCLKLKTARRQTALLFTVFSS